MTYLKGRRGWTGATYSYRVLSCGTRKGQKSRIHNPNIRNDRVTPSQLEGSLTSVESFRGNPARSPLNPGATLHNATLHNAIHNIS